MTCLHTQWLQLSQNQKEWTLTYGARLHDITKRLRDPSSQQPTLILFCGRKAKATALRALFPTIRLKRHRYNDTVADLYLDFATRDATHPTLLADIDLEGDYVNSENFHGCHETTTYSIHWPVDGTRISSWRQMVERIHARLLFSFAQVLCLFVDDLGGMAGVATLLNTWATLGSGSALPKKTRPRLIIVAQDSEAPQSFPLPSHESLLGVFSAMTIVTLSSVRRVSSRTRHQPLRDALKRETTNAQDARMQSRTLFSAVHINLFFERALNQIIREPDQSFDFVSASRDDNAVEGEFSRHVRHFLRLCADQGLPADRTFALIASAIFMDIYPPGMHRKSTVFLAKSIANSSKFSILELFSASYINHYSSSRSRTTTLTQAVAYVRSSRKNCCACSAHSNMKNAVHPYCAATP